MSKAISNIRRPIGIKNVHIAVLTKNDDTGVEYSTPKRVKGVESFQYSPVYAVSNAFSDDIQDTNLSLISSADVQGVFGEYNQEIASILQGHSKEGGGITIKSDDAQQEVALIYEVSNSDNTKTFFIFYRCKMSYEGMTNTTKGENIEFSKANLKGKALPIVKDGTVMRIINSDEPNLKDDFEANFYKNVLLPGASALNG